MGANNQPWPKEQEDELRRLYHFKTDEGYYLSHAYIADSMPGLSRGSVVGKIRRLNLERDPTIPYISSNGKVIDPTLVDFRPRQYREDGTVIEKFNGSNSKKRTSSIPDAGEFKGVYSEFACDTVGLTVDNCHFPIGHVGKEGFHFCGAPQFKGAYCKEHADLCIVPVKHRQREFYLGSRYR